MSALMTRLAASCVLGAALVTAPAMAQDNVDAARRVVPMPGGTDVSMAGRTFADMRFQRIVRQSYDLSCGAAALATILNHYYGLDVGEGDIIEDILTNSTEEQRASIGEAGFSMLELKRHAEAIGFVSGGFRMDEASQLRSLRVPAIALINSRGYAHFVVVKGVDGDDVLIADPAFGNRRRPLEDFAQEWNGVILVIVDPAGQLGDGSFQDDDSARASYVSLQTVFNVVAGGTLPVRSFGEF